VHPLLLIESFIEDTYLTCFNIISQVPRKFTSKVEGKMGYEDFVYFILAEEDKSSEPSLEYWYLFLIHIYFICRFLFLKGVIRLVSRGGALLD